MIVESLKVTWKFIRKASEKTWDGHGKISEAYCSYIIENKNHKHKLRTIEGTKLFELLQTTVISHNPNKLERFNTGVYVDGVYRNNKLQYVKNPRVL
jgi:hypothetical protein